MGGVVLENLSKTFPGPKGKVIHAIHHLHLSVNEGELMVLIGPSGSGKTTLLRLIAGLEKADTGTISMAGQSIDQLPPKDRDVAMVFQHHALYPHLTAYENMALGLKLRRFPRAEIRQRVQEAAKLVNVESCLDRRPGELSGGERQRVALGRALVRRPKLFLFDEPLSHLDAPLRAQLRREIARLHRHLRATMIYVTHDQTEALALGERLAVMKDGIIHQVADSLALHHRPATRFVAGFLGSPSMNFFRGTFVPKESSLTFQTEEPGDLVLRMPENMTPRLTHHVGKRIILGLRPDDIFAHERNSQHSDHPPVAGHVEFVERTGAEAYVHVVAGGQSIVARAGVDCSFAVGQIVPLTLDMTRAYFFDPATELALV